MERELPRCRTADLELPIHHRARQGHGRAPPQHDRIGDQVRCCAGEAGDGSIERLAPLLDDDLGLLLEDRHDLLLRGHVLSIEHAPPGRIDETLAQCDDRRDRAVQPFGHPAIGGRALAAMLVIGQAGGDAVGALSRGPSQWRASLSWCDAVGDQRPARTARRGMRHSDSHFRACLGAIPACARTDRLRERPESSERREKRKRAP